MKDLERKIGYNFLQKELLEQALTHPSYNEHDQSKKDNQRMEFLGDSILSTILSEALFNLFPEEDEGSLSRKRAVFIRGSSLAKIANKLKIQECILMSKAELKNKGNQRSSTLEDALEAIIGAVFLDGGLENAKQCVLKWFGDLKKSLELEQLNYNPKGQLQEILQEGLSQNKIQYQLVKEEGPPHNKHFEIDLIIGKKTLGFGKGKTKKEAEEQAAKMALLKISDDYKSSHARASK